MTNPDAQYDDPQATVNDVDREERRSTPISEADHYWPRCQCRGCALEEAGL